MKQSISFAAGNLFTIKKASVNALATPGYSYSCGLVLEIMFVVPAPNAVQ